MGKFKQKIAFSLALALLANLLLPGTSVFAVESTNDFVVPGSNEQILISPDAFDWGEQTSTTKSTVNLSIEINNNTKEVIVGQILEDKQKTDKENAIESQFAWVAGLYLIPGVGEVTIVATGVIVVGGVTLAVGSYLYNQITDYLAKAEKEEVNVSGKSGWTKTNGESDILNKVNGRKGSTTKGRDGTIKTDIVDKTTGKKIGEIHKKQPEKVNKDRKDYYTGRKYPDHYHDEANRLGRGSDHHWYW